MRTPFHEAFLERAAATPHATALVDRDRSVTYGELERRSRAIACELSAQGLAAGDRVGLALPKSIDAVAGALGVLRAGGAYVPLDEQSPPRRQALVLRDCQVRGLVTDSVALDRLRRAEPEVPALDILVDPSGTPETNCAPQVRPSSEDPAYLLYTSGSTGQPKGVVISHSAAGSFVDWAVRTFELGPEDRLANIAQLSFDLSVFDVFGALSSGARVHLYGAELLLRPRELARALREHGITTYYGVPSAIRLLVHEGDIAAAPPAALRRVLFAGEVFPVPQLRRAMQALPAARFHNLFGPTETNVCTYYSLPPELPADATSVPIGSPCDHLYVALLDEAGRPVAGDAEGELCVAGPAVMTGYWGRRELTSAAFWPAGTVPKRGALYRTGDRARRAAGLLWFLGRRDRQLKLRGYRVELGEIEAALASLPGAREIAVVTVPDSIGFKLKAIIVPETGADLDVLSVKSHCSRLLPPYMVPASVELRGALPRTATGKIDRARL